MENHWMDTQKQPLSTFVCWIKMAHASQNKEDGNQRLLSRWIFMFFIRRREAQKSRRIFHNFLFICKTKRCCRFDILWLGFVINDCDNYKIKFPSFVIIARSWNNPRESFTFCAAIDMSSVFMHEAWKKEKNTSCKEF